jgi:multicomponent Na+:H+ antiporter subunit D
MTAETLLLLAPCIPLLGALLIGLAGRYPNLREGITLAIGLTLLGAVGYLASLVRAGARPELSFIEMMPGMEIAFAIEPLGMLFALLAALLWPVASLYSIGYMRGNDEKNQTRFYICFAIAIASVMGVAFAGNLLTLFIFYEALTLSTYPLVTHKGSPDAIRAGRVYLGILLTTSIGFFLPAIIWTWSLAGTLDFIPGGILANTGVSPVLAGVLLILFIFGIGKAAIMPVHRWLPAAMVAPTPVSALLHAVAVVKAGVFTVIKVVLYTFGTDFLTEVPSQRLLLYLAGFTVVAASTVALRQTEFKRLLAYSTISQLSYVILAALALAPLSEVGAAIHLVAHAFGKITLFFVAGSIYVAAHKSNVLQFRGIGRRMPVTMTAYTIGALSMIGVPPTGGFVSKWYIIAGAFQTNDYFVLAVLVLSTALNAAYFLPIVFQAFLMPEDHTPHHEHGEAPWPMVAALTITATLTVLFFLFHGPVVAFEYGILSGATP